MAAAIEELNFNKLPGHLVVSRAKKLVKDDWVVLPYKGILPVKTSLGTGAAETRTYATLTVNNPALEPGTGYDEKTLSIDYDGATAGTRAAKDYYIRTSSGEILLVGEDDGADDIAGTLTVKQRGCFGTTISAVGLNNDDTLYVLQSLTLTSGTTGIVDLVYMPLPDDPAVNLYGVAGAGTRVDRLYSYEFPEIDISGETATVNGPTFPDGGTVLRAYMVVTATITSGSPAATISLGISGDLDTVVDETVPTGDIDDVIPLAIVDGTLAAGNTLTATLTAGTNAAGKVKIVVEYTLG